MGAKKIELKIVDAGLRLLGKRILKISSINGSGITLANNEIKDIMKLINDYETKSLEN